MNNCSQIIYPHKEECHNNSLRNLKTNSNYYTIFVVANRLLHPNWDPSEIQPPGGESVLKVLKGILNFHLSPLVENKPCADWWSSFCQGSIKFRTRSDCSFSTLYSGASSFIRRLQKRGEEIIYADLKGVAMATSKGFVRAQRKTTYRIFRYVLECGSLYQSWSARKPKAESSSRKIKLFCVLCWEIPKEFYTHESVSKC